MGRILEEGLAEMQQGEARRQFIAGAAQRFEQLGTPQAIQTAQLIREAPEAASAHMDQFGGWGSVYNLMRADAARTALTSAIGQLGDSVSEQDAVRKLLPVAIQYGVGGDLIGTIAKAYGNSSAPPEFVGQIDPDLYENYGEFYSQGAKTGDWAGATSILRSRKSGKGDLVGNVSPSDFTPESVQRFVESGGDYRVLVRRAPAAAAPAPDRRPMSTAYAEKLAEAKLTPPGKRTAEQKALVDEAVRMDPIKALTAGILGGNAGASGEEGGGDAADLSFSDLVTPPPARPLEQPKKGRGSSGSW